jgi:hypothetical protein
LNRKVAVQGEQQGHAQQKGNGNFQRQTHRLPVPDKGDREYWLIAGILQRQPGDVKPAENSTDHRRFLGRLSCKRPIPFRSNCAACQHG